LAESVRIIAGNRCSVIPGNDCSPQFVIELFMRGNALRFFKIFLGDAAKSKKNLKKVSPCEEARMKE